jgi:hypothetical protein
LERSRLFAKELEQRHSPQDWKVVLNKTAEMMINLGNDPELKSEDFELLDNEVLLSVGDRDNMVSIEETVDVYRKFKKGSLLVIPGTPHPIERISVERLNFEIINFIKSKVGEEMRNQSIDTNPEVEKIIIGYDQIYVKY